MHVCVQKPSAVGKSSVSTGHIVRNRPDTTALTTSDATAPALESAIDTSSIDEFCSNVLGDSPSVALTHSHTQIDATTESPTSTSVEAAASSCTTTLDTSATSQHNTSTHSMAALDDIAVTIASNIEVASVRPAQNAQAQTHIDRRSIVDIDARGAADACNVTEYVETIVSYLRDVEVSQMSLSRGHHLFILCLFACFEYALS
jgi:hypothetical protein